MLQVFCLNGPTKNLQTIAIFECPKVHTIHVEQECTSIENIDLNGLSFLTPQALVNLFAKMRMAKIVDVSQTAIDLPTLEKTISEFTQLQQLRANRIGWYVSSSLAVNVAAAAAVTEVNISSASLRQLWLNDIRAGTISKVAINCPKLRLCSLKQNTMEAQAVLSLHTSLKSAPNLKLQLNKCVIVGTKSELQPSHPQEGELINRNSIIPSLSSPTLQLDLSYMLADTAVMTDVIASFAPRLSSLTLARNSTPFRLEFTNYPKLQTLEISKCPELCILSVKNCAHMVTVQLTNCHLLQELEISQCPSIKELSVQSCTRLFPSGLKLDPVDLRGLIHKAFFKQNAGKEKAKY